MSRWKKITDLDRRWIFLLMALAVFIPQLYPVNLPFEVSKPVQDLYDKIESLPNGSKVLVSADYDPSSQPELQPFFKAFLHHAAKKDLKLIIVSLWPAATSLVLNGLDEVTVQQYNKEYGKDYVYLGYKAGTVLVILGMGDDVHKTFPMDYTGKTPTADMPVMKGIQNLSDFEVIVSISAGSGGTKEYVQFVQARYDLDVCSATTAVSAPDYYAYYQSGQLFGLVGGMKGSAEYEKAVGVPDQAVKGMDSQNFAHALIIFLIILTNIIYFTTRKEGA